MKVRVLHLGEQHWVVRGVPGRPDVRYRFDPSSPYQPLGLAAKRPYVSQFDELEVDRADLVREGEEPKATGPRFPDVSVRLVGEEGNAFAILGEVEKALRRAGVSSEEVRSFRDDATSSGYDHLLRTVMAWVEVE